MQQRLFLKPAAFTCSPHRLRANPGAALLAVSALLALPLVSAPSAHALAPVRFADAPHAAPTAAPQATAAASPAGFGRLDPAPPTGLTAEQIITRFGARESEFNKARNDYTFRQTVRVETILDETNKPDGVYQEVTDIVFDDSDRRSEHVVYAPQNTLDRVMLTQSDFDDIAHRLPFVLTTADLPEYDITYLGRQKVDDLDTYVFNTAPHRLEKGKRYFQGKIWVDQRDLQIVLINGRNVPQDMRRGHEDLSPPFTTYYSEVDGGYWFPVYTKGEGNLHFPGQGGAAAMDVHMRYKVTYTDYKRFHSKSRIIYNGADLAPAAPNAPPAAPAKPELTPDPPTALPPRDPDAPPLSRPRPQPHP